jgi:amidohydrolase
MDQSLYEQAQGMFEYTQALRRDFHRHPELGLQEIRTAGIVAKELTDLGLEVATGVGQTGVVAMMEGEKPGPVILVRFDMDALPVLEETGAEYASQNPGIMHACGHDGHVAVGLTVARMLNEKRKQLNGSVKFVFQPGEEGLGGARKMVEAGVLENPRPAYTLALHLWNDMPVGWAGIVPGPLMAGAALFTIKLTGRGGHGALPQQTIDPVIAAAQIVIALQTIVSRNVSPLKAAVVSVTSVLAGDAYNVIPARAELRGTLRFFEPEVKALLFDQFNRIATGIGATFGCQVEIILNDLTPAVINHSALANRISAVAADFVPGLEIGTAYRLMVSEDMAVMMQDIPGLYMLVGSANSEKGLNFGHHHPRFDIDEQAMVNASAIMAGAVIHLLSEA